MKVLYLYSGGRKNKFKGQIGLDYADTQFYGLNHLPKFGIKAETKEFADLVKNNFLRKLFGFRFRHIILGFTGRRYDLVFGPALLYSVLFKKIFCPKTKFVLLNFDLVRILENNRQKRFKTLIIRWLLKKIDGVICLSHWQLDYLAGTELWPQSKLFYIPLGVDTNFYHFQTNYRQDYVLAVGRDTGRDYQTATEVARLLPNQEFHFVCSSRNLQDLGDLPSNIKVFYDLSLLALKKKYEEAKILILLTKIERQQEGADCSGQTVLLDAMAAGLPVIVSQREYLADYLTTGEEGLIVPPYQPKAVKIAIESLTGLRLRLALAQKARRRVEEQFSTQAMAESLAIVFKSILHEDHF